MKDLTWYGYDITDEKSLRILIIKMEKMIRTSIEYNIFAYKYKEDVDACPLCGNSFLEERSKPIAEVHHHPLTLYEIVANKLTEKMCDNTLKTYTPLNLVNEIMQDHLDGKIKCIVLCKYCHDAWHIDDPNVTEKLLKYIETFGLKEEAID